MIRPPSVLRDVSVAVAAVVLALLVGLSAAAPGHAVTSEPTPSDTTLIAISGPLAPDNKAPKPSPTPTSPSSAPVIVPPAPVPPAPAAPAPAPVPTLAPEPTVSPAEETPSEAPSTVPSPSPSSATPSTESNWNKPITKSPTPTQAAAVSRTDGSGLFGIPGLLAIMAGVMLVGVAGLAFAWWSRNRLSSH